MLVRCSAISQIMAMPRNKSEALSDAAKSFVRNQIKEDLFGYVSFDGNKYTRKGNELEELAIKLSGFSRGRVFKKNEERKENNWITGECDIYDDKRKIIIDTKCSWDIGTHPFFIDEATDKAKKAGYDYQMQGYMWLWDCEQAEIDFCLFPTPFDLLSQYDNIEQHIDLVEQIPQKQRITTVVIKRDEKIIESIKERVEAVHAYYQQLITQIAA